MPFRNSKITPRIGLPSCPTILVWAALNTGDSLNYANAELKHLEALEGEGICRVIIHKNKPLFFLPQALIEHEPDIFHFIGHGDQVGRPIFNETNSGGQVPVGPEELMNLMESTPHEGLYGLYLNACWTSRQGPRFTPNGGWLVSMNTAVEDEIASEFAPLFYRNMLSPTNPLPVNSAIEQAKMELLQHGAFETELTQTFWYSESTQVSFGKALTPQNFLNMVFNRGAFRSPTINEVTIDSLRIAINHIYIALHTGQISIRETGQPFLTVDLDSWKDQDRNTLLSSIIKMLGKLNRLLSQFSRDYPEFNDSPAAFYAIPTTAVPQILRRMDDIDAVRNLIIRTVNSHVHDSTHPVLEEIVPSSQVFANRNPGFS